MHTKQCPMCSGQRGQWICQSIAHRRRPYEYLETEFIPCDHCLGKGFVPDKWQQYQLNAMAMQAAFARE